MDASNLGTFLKEVTQLIDQYDKLKHHTLQLQHENLTLQKANETLARKNQTAQEAVQSIILRLQEVQS